MFKVTVAPDPVPALSPMLYGVVSVHCTLMMLLWSTLATKTPCVPKSRVGELVMLHEAWTEGQTTPSAWGPPLWIPYLCMSVGMALLAVQQALQVVKPR